MLVCYYNICVALYNFQSVFPYIIQPCPIISESEANGHSTASDCGYLSHRHSIAYPSHSWIKLSTALHSSMALLAFFKAVFSMAEIYLFLGNKWVSSACGFYLYFNSRLRFVYGVVECGWRSQDNLWCHSRHCHFNF